MNQVPTLITLNSEIYSLLQSFSITSDPEVKQQLIDKFEEFSMLFYEEFPLEADVTAIQIPEPEKMQDDNDNLDLPYPLNPEPVKETTRKQQINLSGIFTVNDRFLYIREIFEGDANRFKTALEEMVRLGNAEAVDEYMTGVLNLDPDNETQAAFMDTIRKHF